MKKLWKPVLLLAAVAIMAFGMLSSGAWFTDTATSQPNTIKAGTLSIDEGAVSTKTITVPNMAPGDVTDPIEIIIENGGSLDLAWFGNLQMSTSILKNVVYIESATMEFLSPGGASWEPTSQFLVAGGGNPLGDPGEATWYNSLKDPQYGVITLAKFDGSSGMAPGTGYEFMGALKPNYKYKLTLILGMAGGAGNEYQGAGPLEINFKVDATQINVAAMQAINPSLGGMLGWMDAQIAKQLLVP